MTLIFLWVYTFIFLCCLLAGVYLTRLRRQVQKAREAANQLEDLLDSAPDGYFCSTVLKKKEYTRCSRRLCLLLNIVETNASLSAILDRLSADDARLLAESFQNLTQKNMPFELTVSTEGKKLYFMVVGRVLHTADKNLNSYVLWFKDVTHKTALLIEERKAYTQLLQQREIFTKTLNALPFPLYVEDQSGAICFSNKAYLSAGEDLMDMHWVEMPLSLGKNMPFLLKYGQDKTTEEGLSILLKEAEQAHRTVLKEIPFGVVLFSSTARLTFFNGAFCNLWGIDSHWLRKEPLYAEFLDKIQEKGMLPQVKDFAQYKKVQMKNFAQLTRVTEEYLYLPKGQIIRRLMIPYAQGSVLMMDELKTPPTG